MDVVAEVPREKLRQIVEKNGEAILQDSDRVEGLLRDHCGSHRKEISALVGALNERVPLELRSSWQTAMTPEAMRARLVQRLEDNRGLAPEVADWAVEAWSYALGIGLGRRSDRLDSIVLGHSSQRQEQLVAGGAGMLTGADPGPAPKPSSDGVRGDRAGGAAGAAVVGTALLANTAQKKKAGVGVGILVAAAVAVYAFSHHPTPPVPTPAPTPVAVNPPAAKPTPVVPVVHTAPVPLMPAGTSIAVRLNQGINSDEATVGQAFTATVATPVMANGKVVLPVGSDATLRVLSIDKAGKVSGKAVIRLQLQQVSVGARAYQVAGSVHEIDGPAQAATAAEHAGIGGAIGAGVGFIGGKIFHHGKAGAGTGVLVGGTTGVVLTKPKPAVAPAEMLLQFRLVRAVAAKG